ncbi:cadherin-like beta sandwich domain-containing protein [Anaeromicropila herbilytica]|uniref:SH3b domain-containing protein n=1 Tax=Anaeromicropila herbilytica TaxID=2785025 RepID=A0A7R7ICG6_9FIRM|nr:cadherin-like beta sandwich domain-containing protein [Anaeromicropila herbilytica]BCN29841.1 hypothetical protein bsdtb5_11360 [Anaeromicropila herbilytica]
MQKRWKILLSICFLLTFSGGVFIYNKIDTYAVEKGIVTATTLNVRKGAGTNYSIVMSSGKKVTLTKNTAVSIEKKSNGWYYISVKFNGATVKGYVLDDYVKINAGTTTAAKITSSNSLKLAAKITATKLNVRTTPSTTGEQLTINKVKVSLVKNSSVTILNEKMVGSKKWYYISFQVGKSTYKGYILSDFVKLELKSNINAKVNSKSKISIRTGAGSNKAYLKDSNNKTVTLSSGTALKISKEVTIGSDKWFYVSFTYNKNNKKGYILAKDVLFSATTSTSTKNTSNNSSNTTTPNKTNSDTDNSKDTNTNNNSSNSSTGTDQGTNNNQGSNAGSNNNVGNTNSKIVIDKNQSSKDGKVIGTNALNVRIGAGTSNDKLIYNNKTISLALGTPVNIYDEKQVSSTTWYLVSFEYSDVELAGYVSGSYIQVLDSTDNTDTSTPTTPSPTTTPTTPTTPDTNNTAMTTEEFEASLTNEGFPDSYKVLLRSLHNQYPNWKFKAYKTGVDWNTAVTNESKVGLNLITNSKNIAWKSLATGAYSWEKDRFIPYDGATWVTASKDAIAYYMDPRNFLTANKIFQFESLSYQSGYQNQSGVERILMNTPLYNTSFTYDDSNGNEVTKTYSETFMSAADYSNVSPYHLATRVKQEVMTSSTALSSSASGNYSGFEGYYNFYNIGAYHSTVAGGAIKNALTYAMNGSTSQTTNALYLIPWDNQYSAIVGGAKFIGASYIDRGQSTIYLQKFNVTPKSMYSHQYMANVEAASSEATKTYSGYSSMLELPIVFTIPVYNNMPNSVCAAPKDVKNPNNWLSNLSIEGYSLTPTFDLSKDQVYNLIVDNDISEVTVDAQAVSSKATVSGTGVQSLEIGNNVVTVNVTAENGKVRKYEINIVRSE